MFDVAISQLSAPRMDLGEELAAATSAGFNAIALWRPKVADVGLGAVASALACAGVRAASLQWAGGFTAGDGRSFAESVADAREAIDAARLLAAPVLVVHSGCRGGHTRAHAIRLVRDALESLAPAARAAEVTLAVRPIHAAVAPGCSLLTRLADALDLVRGIGDPTVRLAVDLWQFADAAELPALLSELADCAAVVQVADRIGPPSTSADRLPAGRGTLPLEPVLEQLFRHGYRGPVEFDPVGDMVDTLGHGAVLRETAATAAAWCGGLVADGESAGCLSPPRSVQRRPAAVGTGSRRSHASSHSVSRG